MARDGVRLLDWLNGSPGQWGVWIGAAFIVAVYDNLFAVFERQSGNALRHGSVGEHHQIDQMLLESSGEAYEFF